MIFSITESHSKKNICGGYCRRACDVALFTWLQTCIVCILYQNFVLTEVAGEGGPDLALQKFLLSQQFRHLMG